VYDWEKRLLSRGLIDVSRDHHSHYDKLEDEQQQPKRRGKAKKSTPKRGKTPVRGKRRTVAVQPDAASNPHLDASAASLSSDIQALEEIDAALRQIRRERTDRR
jgi:hypothetical protein